MEESCQRESLSSCRNASEVAFYVRKKVELCIQNCMSYEEAAKYLEKNHQIREGVTHSVWEQLRKENPDFFSHLDLRRQLALQMRRFNDMLTKQAVRMFQDGLLDICDASPKVRSLIRQQDPERVHLLETLASKRKQSSARTALPYANGPSVAQSQNPYHQQDQVLSSARFAMPYANGSSVAQSRNQYDQVFNSARFAMHNPSGPSVVQSNIYNDQFNDHLYSAVLAMPNANGPSVTQLPNPYGQQDQPLYTTSLPLPNSNGPSMMQLPTPYDQQDQPLYTTNSPFPYANVTPLPFPHGHQNPWPAYNDLIYNSLGAPTFEPESSDDWLLSTDPAYEDPGALQPFPPPASNQWPSSDESFSCSFPIDTSTMPELVGDSGHSGLSYQADDIIQHLNGQYQPHLQVQQNVQVEGSNGLENGYSIDDLLYDNFDITYTESEALNNPNSGDTGHNGPSFPDMYMKSASTLVLQPDGIVKRHYPESEALNNQDSAQLVTQPSEQLQQHQNGHYQPQENVPVETLQREGRSNRLMNGESSDQRFCNNFDKSHSKRMCTSVDQKQAGRVVKRQHPETEAGNGTPTTVLNHQRSPKARATTRSVKEWEQYDNE